MDANGGTITQLKQTKDQKSSRLSQTQPIKRIALSGSGGTGKTTLAKAATEILGWPQVNEGVRDYLDSKGIKHLRELSPKDTFEMQLHILSIKVAKENQLHRFIADRCTVDNAAYALRWCARDIPEQPMRKYVMDAFKHALSSYDLIVFLPCDVIKLEDDNIRSSIAMYQYEIDALIRGLLSKWDLPVHFMHSITLHDRVKELLALVKE